MPNFKIYIGKNKSGKTHILKGQNQNDAKILYLPIEARINELMKENLELVKKSIWSPHQKLLDFINELYSINSKNIIDGQKFNELDKIKKNFSHDGDEYWENTFLKNIKINKSQKEIGTGIKDFLLFEDIEKIDLSNSGIKHYSLLKIIYELIKGYNSIEDHRKIAELNQFYLKFDEPEKFCHPELIDKMAHIIFNISKYINVEIATHSNIFLNRIFKLDSLRKEQRKGNIEYIYCYSSKDKEDKINYSFKILNLKSVLQNENSRIINDIFKSLFSSSLIFAEGLNDEVFINAIYESEFIDKYLTIIDCYGKSNIKKCAEIMIKLGMAEHINICVFYDEDNDGTLGFNRKKIFDIMIPNNLEEHFFEKTTKQKVRDKCYYLTKSKNCSSKKNLEIKFQNLTALKISSTKKDVEERLKIIISKLKIWINKEWKKSNWTK